MSWSPFPHHVSAEAGPLSVPAAVLPYVLLLHKVPRQYRECVIAASVHLLGHSINDRSHWFEVMDTWSCAFENNGPSWTSSHEPGSLPTNTQMAAAPSSLSGNPEAHLRTPYRNTNGIPSALSSCQDSPSPYNVTGNSTPLDSTNPPTPASQPYGGPSTSASSRNDTVQLSSNTSPPPVPTKKKWVCPVCEEGFTRFPSMSGHVKSQCLDPKMYPSYRHAPSAGLNELGQNNPDPAPCHCPPDTVPRRRMFASALTSELFNTQEELIGDAHKRCFRKGIPEKSQSRRLKALLGEDNIRELNKELEDQCRALGWREKAWKQLTWDRDVAFRFATMAEFGLQRCTASTTRNGSPDCASMPCSRLIKSGLGIGDLRAYVCDVLQQSKEFSDNQQEPPHSATPATTSMQPAPPIIRQATPQEIPTDPGNPFVSRNVVAARNSNRLNPNFGFQPSLISQQRYDQDQMEGLPQQAHGDLDGEGRQRPPSVSMEGYTDEPVQQSPPVPSAELGGPVPWENSPNSMDLDLFVNFGTFEPLDDSGESKM